MASWIYILSKFTPEALLLEATAILALTGCYAAFWVLRKRRLGSVDNEVPSSVVKEYLNELIGEAHGMRTQLFGLLGNDGPVTRATGRVFPMQGMSTDTSVDLSGLEKKMADQAAALEKILTEKSALEKELAAAKAAPPVAATGGSDAEMKTLREKLADLEARLAEYSIIEDDLANLKRLQQENAQLKAQLAGGPPPAAAAPAPVAAAPTAAAPEAAAPAPTTDPVKLEEAPVVTETPAAAAPPSPSPASAPAAPAPPPVDDSEFATLAGDVQKSMDAPAAPAAVDPLLSSLGPESSAASPQTATASSVTTPPVEKNTAEKSDEDLIAEFEKMLNS